MKKLLAAATAALALSCPAQRIAVLSDIHVSPGNAADSALRAAVAEINRMPYDLVVVNGDLTNEGSDAELHNVHAILADLRRPTVVVPGNHENTWSQSAVKTYGDLWGQDRFVRPLGKRLTAVGINCGPYMKMGDGHIKQEDLHWLRRTLDSAVRANPDGQIVSFNHYPLRRDDLDNYQEYIDLLAQYPVLIHINGHYHHWMDYMAGPLRGVMTRALLMKDGSYGYAVVDVSRNWIHVYDKPLGKAVRPMFAYPRRVSAPVESGRTALVYPSFDFRADTAAAYAPARLLAADSASVFTRLGIDAERLYYGTSTGMVKALDRRSGRLLWQRELGGSLYGRPVVLAAGRLGVPYNRGIAILDARSGRTVSDIPSAEGPYVADGLADARAWYQGGYKRMECRDPKSGRLRWSFTDLDNYCQASPVLDGNDLLFGAWDTRLRCLDARSGKLRWAWDNGKPNRLFSPGNVVPVVTPERVYIVAPDRFMTAIDRRTGRTLWRNNSHRFRESMGRSADGSRIYAKTMDGTLVAVDATAPEYRELWTVDLTLGYEHAPCIVAESDGVVYTGSRRGLVTATDVSDPAHPRLLWVQRLGSSEVNGIDLDPATGEVFVSLIEGSVWQIK